MAFSFPMERVIILDTTELSVLSETKQKWDYRIILAWDEDVVVFCNIHE